MGPKKKGNTRAVELIVFAIQQYAGKLSVPSDNELKRRSIISIQHSLAERRKEKKRKKKKNAEKGNRKNETYVCNAMQNAMQ